MVDNNSKLLIFLNLREFVGNFSGLVPSYIAKNGRNNILNQNKNSEDTTTLRMEEKTKIKNVLVGHDFYFWKCDRETKIKKWRMSEGYKCKKRKREIEEMRKQTTK